MEFPDPAEYNKSNSMQIQQAKETIQEILKDELKECNIIVDIGCGSGNITIMLSQIIPHETIYAFDHDVNMVEFAQNSCSDETIQWFLDNIGLQWNDLSSTLKELEGKVSLVWSNYVLHYVEDKDTAMKNVVRLLKPDGRCYLNIAHIPHFNDFLPHNESEENVQFIKYPTLDEDLQLWSSILSEPDWSSFQILQIPVAWKSQVAWNTLSRASNIVLKKFINKSIPEEQKHEYVEKYQHVYLRALATQHGQPLLQELPANPTGYFVQFLVKGIK